MSVFSKQLKADRKKSGFTQQALADAINASHNSVQDWENRGVLPCPVLLIALEDVLGWSRGYSLELIKQG